VGAPERGVHLRRGARLRSPIAAISMGADTLLRLLDTNEPLDPEKARKVIRHMTNSATRLDRMVSDLTDTSRIEARRLALQLQTIELPPLLRGIVDRAGLATTGHPLKLIEPGSLRASSRIRNAWSRPSSIPLQCDEVLRARERDPNRGVPLRRRIEIAVTNQGAGLRPEEQARLFTRFYRTDRARAAAKARPGPLHREGPRRGARGSIWVDSNRASTRRSRSPSRGCATAITSSSERRSSRARRTGARSPAGVTGRGGPARGRRG